jgi:hypothetical protein
MERKVGAYFEEFCWERFIRNYPQMKRLLEGKYFSVDVSVVIFHWLLLSVQ